jgi:hypothetical protein
MQEMEPARHALTGQARCLAKLRGRCVLQPLLLSTPYPPPPYPLLLPPCQWTSKAEAHDAHAAAAAAAAGSVVLHAYSQGQQHVQG